MRKKEVAVKPTANGNYEGAAGKPAANRRYKDTVFRMLFQDKRRLLGLYNAVGGRNYTDPDKLEIITLENAVYMGMKNDLAFLVGLNLYLFEHQSTVNRNMPLRFLQYVSAEYEKLIEGKNLYRDRLIQIPSPHFIVFYNGKARCPERRELKLSDAFLTAEVEPKLELLVRVLNINSGYNEALKEQCRTLKEYMQYVEKVRYYAERMTIEDAVDKAVEECIGQNILREFLLQNKAEVRKMSIYEYDEEEVRQLLKEDAYEDGKIEGRAEEIVETGYEFRLTSEEILARLQNKLNISHGEAERFFDRYRRSAP